VGAERAAQAHARELERTALLQEGSIGGGRGALMYCHAECALHSRSHHATSALSSCIGGSHLEVLQLLARGSDAPAAAAAAAAGADLPAARMRHAAHVLPALQAGPPPQPHQTQPSPTPQPPSLGPHASGASLDAAEWHNDSVGADGREALVPVPVPSGSSVLGQAVIVVLGGVGCGGRWRADMQALRVAHCGAVRLRGADTLGKDGWGSHGNRGVACALGRAVLAQGGGCGSCVALGGVCGSLLLRSRAT
jgi:hypothetical protein